MTRKSSESDVGDAPRNEAARAYSGAVDEIIASTPRDSSWVPEQPLDLRIVRRRQPQSIADLEPEERLQLAALFAPEPLEKIVDPSYTVDDFGLSLEVAAVVDDTGTVRYRLYGWDFGVGYLMAASGLECIALACQHDLEHWNLAQRPIFWAMDRALQRKDHGFQQPLTFCWWRQECWDEIADEEPGTVRSEPWIRKQLAGFARSS